MHQDDLERLAVEVQGLDRDTLLQRLRSEQFDFALDFTEEYLSQRNTNQLRHILMAAYLHAQTHFSGRT